LQIPKKVCFLSLLNDFESTKVVTGSAFVSQHDNDDDEFCCNHRLCVAMSIGAMLIAACVIPLLAISGFMNVASLAAIGSVAGMLSPRTLMITQITYILVRHSHRLATIYRILWCHVRNVLCITTVCDNHRCCVWRGDNCGRFGYRRRNHDCEIVEGLRFPRTDDQIPPICTSIAYDILFLGAIGN
jgi:hypothetical protein